MSAPEPLLRFRRMTCRYGPVAAVDGLTLEVGRGELVGLIGPDGAGKTTALRAALGLRRPDEGSVETCGLDPARQSRRLSARVGYLPQRFSLYGDLSADENLAFFAAIHAVRGWRERRERLLDLVRLGPFRRRLADRLSGGMRQKLAVACTLIHSPDLLILDEPTTGVDPVSRRDLWALLARLQAGGMTIVLSTPYLDEAERCGRVALLDRGRLLATDRPEALRASFSGALVEILARPRREALARLRALPEAGEVETFGERFHCRLPGAAAAAEAAAALAGALRGGGLEVAVARPIAPSLEDVFLARIRAADDAAAAHPGRAAGG